MRIILVWLLVAGVVANARANGLEHQISNGTLNVDGSKASKQVIVQQNNKTCQLIHYTCWENICIYDLEVGSLFIDTKRRGLI